MKKWISSLMATILMASIIATPALANENGDRANNEVSLANEAKSAILLERDTGEVLYEKNSHEKLPPASMTKIMTMMLIMEALDTEKILPTDKVRTSEYAASMGGSQIFLEPGEEMTVEEMLKGIAIGSANDASVAMAEHLAGSEEGFVQMMNEKVKELGLKDTQFRNPTGLPAEGHYSSAYDMAMMGRELLKYEGITKFTGSYESYLRENSEKKFWLVNTNKLVRFYPGVDGIKTGFTNEAKYCLTATANKGNMRVIASVFGAPTPKVRNAEVTKLLDYAFAQYMTHPLYKKADVLGEAKISKGSKSYVNAETSEPISVLTKKGEKVDGVEEEVKFDTKLKAPVEKGQQVGTLTVKRDGKVVVETPIVASETIEAASWWKLFKDTFGQFSKTGK